MGPGKFFIVGLHLFHVCLLFFEFFKKLILVRQNTFLVLGLEFGDFLLDFVWERGEFFEGFGWFLLVGFVTGKVQVEVGCKLFHEMVL